MAYPTVTFDNQLSIPVLIYDSYNNDVQDTSLANYFGTLTQVGTTVASGTTADVDPIHGPVSAYIVYDTANNPVKRVYTKGAAPVTFTITQADVDVITLTQDFIQFLADSPADPVTVSFQALIKDGTATASQINDFFLGSTCYQTCTYISYMLVLTTLARTPETAPLPIPQKTYRLSVLLHHLGVSWPASLPDIVVSNFSCTDDNDQIKLSCDLDISKVTFDEGVLDNVLTFLPETNVTAHLFFNYGPSLSFLSTTLEFTLDDIKIPIGNNDSMHIDKPTLILSIAPLFKFVVFEVKATIPFSLFNSPTFNADVAMTIDNVEAEIGVVLEGNNNTLLTPAVMKGVHFDSLGVGMGLIFEPPSAAVGVQGAFHIGSAGSVALDDDQFAVVCSLAEAVPVPLYISFYVPQLTLADAITLFTNTSSKIDFPISMRDLSFKWAENPMEPVTLPDGSLAAMAYGFSGYLDFFGLGFYGDVAIDLSKGLTGNVTMSPYNLGPLHLTGDGKGVSIKVDDKGNPIRNNFIPTTAADQAAVQNAGTKQLVAPGGPSMTVSTSGSPYFDLDAKLKFLDFYDSIKATVASSGITYDLVLLTTQVHCTLKDYQNFTGTFSYGPDFTVPLPAIAGFSPGSIHFNATINATLSVSVSNSVVAFSVGGGFTLFGLSPTIGPVTLDINISSITQVFAAIEQWIISNAGKLFGSLYADAQVWINDVNTSVIQPLEQGAEHLAQGLATAYQQTINEASVLLKTTVYAVDEVAAALHTVYNAGANDLAKALQYAGYGVQDAANALNSLDYDAQEAASALNSAFGATPDVVNSVMQVAGYSTDEIKSAFKSLGGAFSSFASSTWKTVSHYTNPKNW